AAGNPSRMARDKPVASLAAAAVRVAASVRIHGAPVASSFRATVSVAASVNLHGASPCHRSKLLTQALQPVVLQFQASDWRTRLRRPPASAGRASHWQLPEPRRALQMPRGQAGGL